MTTNSTISWDNIETPPRNSYNVKLIKDSEAVPLYWGKDTEGRCLFIVELEGNHKEYFKKNQVSVHGINIDLRKSDVTSNQNLVLTLEEHMDRDLFGALCETLISSLQKTTDSAVALSATIAQLLRWKKFLAGRKPHILSKEEIRGLFAELTFLRTLCKKCHSETSALEAWGGSNGHQDFTFGNISYEIKALSGKERNSVHISSENQLEVPASCSLFLIVYRLGMIPQTNQPIAMALSLNDIVKNIENELEGQSTLEMFLTKLASYGYIMDLHEYDDPKFTVINQMAFQVSNDFPRIVRSKVPMGITRVNYEIELEAISKFEHDMTEIWGT